MFHFVFVRETDHDASCLPEGKLDGKKLFRLTREQGYELVWDSAPSCDDGYAFAAREYDAYPERCAGCHLGFQFDSLGLYRGQRVDYDRGRWVVFSGYLCEGCCSDPDMFRVRWVGAHPNAKPTSSA